MSDRLWIKFWLWNKQLQGTQQGTYACSNLFTPLHKYSNLPGALRWSNIMLLLKHVSRSLVQRKYAMNVDGNYRSGGDGDDNDDDDVTMS